MLFIQKHPQYMNKIAFKNKIDTLPVHYSSIPRISFIYYQFFKVLYLTASRVASASLLMTHTYSITGKKLLEQ